MAVCAICLHPGVTAGEHECPGIGEIQLSRHLGHGLVVDQAPPRIRMALRVLSTAQYGAALQEPDLINIGDQVLYRVTGYDPEHAALLLDLVEDWRPKSTEADRVRALHHDWENDPGHCAHCTGPDGNLVRFPCPTIRALDGEEQPGA